MKKSLLLLILGACLLLPLFAGGVKEAEPAALPEKPVKIALLNGPSGIGLVNLISEDIFSDPSVEVDVQVLGAPKVLLGQMLKEEWDAAVLPANMAAILFNKGVGYRLAALTGMGNLYLVGSDSLEISSPEDLEGLTIHIPGMNTTPDLVTRLIADEGGLDLNLDYSFNPSDLAKALAGGVADAGVLPEPLATVAMKSSKDLKIVLDMQRLWSETFPDEGDYPLTVLVVKSSFAENWPQLTDELLKAGLESIVWVDENPAEASKLIGEYGFTLPAPVVEQAIPRSNYTFVTGEDLPAVMSPYFQRVFGLDPAAIGGKVPESGLYY
ncbi:MAG: ABC transporter substrate-binding protein [Spirochaetales bacterium]|nr:ABC transporter substrate-binding protein [Spirochaetales bacterium]